MESDISLRALDFCKYKGITAADFERICGLANGMLKKLGANTRKQTYIRISNAFPELDVEWLRTGLGEMLVQTPKLFQTGNGNVLQHGHAGHDLTQNNNSEKLLADFIEGLKSQNLQTERAMIQLDKAMSQTESAMRQTDSAMNQAKEVITQMGKTIEEISEQRKLVDRLISIIEKK